MHGALSARAVEAKPIATMAMRASAKARRRLTIMMVPGVDTVCVKPGLPGQHERYQYLIWEQCGLLRLASGSGITVLEAVADKSTRIAQDLRANRN